MFGLEAAMPGMSERFELRLDEEMLESIDGWRSRQTGAPSRASAIRQLIEKGIAAEQPRPTFRASGVERIMLMMLADICQHLEVEADSDPEFIKATIFNGQDWAFAWKYHGLLRDSTPSEELVTEVAHILEMWSILEASYENLTAKQKEQVATEFGEGELEVRFDGFDGNNEGEHFSVASFMVQDLKRFDEFATRDLNSHRPTLQGYRRMLPVYRRLAGRSKLTPSALVEILDARRHPEQRSRRGSAE
jgi:uncharacterized protein YfbU (UPF0304 family)